MFHSKLQKCLALLQIGGHVGSGAYLRSGRSVNVIYKSASHPSKNEPDQRLSGSVTYKGRTQMRCCVESMNLHTFTPALIKVSRLAEVLTAERK
jgi:hypothetical protein